MTSTATKAGSRSRAHGAPDGPADVLVVFGITGDLARVMTFHSLYRLEQRGLLNCPVIGVASHQWRTEDLRHLAGESIEARGEPIDAQTFDRLAARLCYLAGDLTNPDTYRELARILVGARRPVFYLELPPFLFGTVVRGLHEAGLAGSARILVEKPFGNDLPSAVELADELHEYVDESQLFRVDHFLGKAGFEELFYLRFANTMLEPFWNRHHVASIQVTLAEDFGVDERGHFYDGVGALRDVCVNHLMELLSAAAMEPPAGRDPDAVKDKQVALWAAMETADPSAYVRGQYDGYRDIEGVAHDSTTETYAALRLEIDNWRWSGVPIFLRAGKQMPVLQTEFRLVFHRPPRLGLQRLGHGEPPPDQLVVRLDPSAGLQLHLDTRGADGEPAPVTLDRELAREGTTVPTPYEVLLLAALEGDGTRFGRQDGVEQRWRVMQPLVEHPPAVQPYAPGSWGPVGADHLLGEYGPWQQPWLEPRDRAEDVAG
jgi:glucose-6-phosphate 1-dehydrogenase